uniref:Uncharacterized protein n=1 Tax=Timema monikensis TaxID=170555 RepID=A0A7R9E9Y1_9NEOP|nr:unnamed protein product [Timema monikensis]
MLALSSPTYGSLSIGIACLQADTMEILLKSALTLEQEMAAFSSLMATACSSSNSWTTYKQNAPLLTTLPGLTLMCATNVLGIEIVKLRGGAATFSWSESGKLFRELLGYEENEMGLALLLLGLSGISGGLLLGLIIPPFPATPFLFLRDSVGFQQVTFAQDILMCMRHEHLTPLCIHVQVCLAELTARAWCSALEPKRGRCVGIRCVVVSSSREIDIERRYKQSIQRNFDFSWIKKIVRMSDGRKRLSGAECKKKAKIKKEEQDQVIRKMIKIDSFFKSGRGTSVERPGTSTTCTDTIQSGQDETDLNSATQQQQSSVEQSIFEKTDIYVFDEEVAEESSISIKIEDASQIQMLSNDQVQTSETTVNINKDPALWEINDTLREIITSAVSGVDGSVLSCGLVWVVASHRVASCGNIAE